MLGISLGGFAAIAAALSVALAGTTSPPNRYASSDSSASSGRTAAGWNSDCTLVVPENPLSAQGLATPYRLVATGRDRGQCHEADARQAAFVQATVIDSTTGALSVYNPLVVDQGSRPAVAPVVPRLPRHAVVGIWFGFNGHLLTLRSERDSLQAGRCVSGSSASAFGAFAYCNAPAFFATANWAERAGWLTVPRLGIGLDGAPCPTIRDFGFVDDNQSNGVTTSYLVDRRGRTAQWTTSNSWHLDRVATLVNSGNNPLLVSFVDKALGCTPWRARDLADPGQWATSLALDELQAARRQAAPIALVPLNGTMVLVRNAPNRLKTDFFRVGVDQPVLTWTRWTNGDANTYCGLLAKIGVWRLNLDRSLFIHATSPVRGTNLATFLSKRLVVSLADLHCRQTVQPAVSSSPTWTPTPTSSPTLNKNGDMAPQPSTLPTGMATVNKKGDSPPQPSTVTP
ncbi:hypothetical protein ABIA33_007168 [Streptacidiphilus sp. MAP12-16]|uniref:hypothetical protein n=1 Tax=Streptacidiphilus sp. MAP12-16 TaxID=3156300 RepID=UPI0035113ACF